MRTTTIGARRGATLAAAAFAAVSLTLGACDRDSTKQSNTPSNGTTTTAPATGTPGAGVTTTPGTTNTTPRDPNAPRDGMGNTPDSTRHAPDNTGRNERDRAGSNQTPMDQGESEADRTMTADIRRAVMDLEDLSINAKNCKIITNNGVVTLRGPVNSVAERDAIERAAKAIAGVTSVVNELEVSTDR
jgi:hyperosmotically inducible periplasmic protein